MAAPRYLKAFKDLLASSPGFADLPEIELESYGNKSDRAAVILQASIVENILQGTIEKKTRPLSRDLRERLFEGNGPLSSFANKINVAYALGVFADVFRHDLDLIRELRNGFAHTRHPTTFSTPQVAEVCRCLKLPDNLQLSVVPDSYYAYFLQKVADQAHPRTRFTVACHTISAHLLVIWPDLEAGHLDLLP